MATRMQQRRGTAEQWTTADPVLAPGEIGFETDTNQFKVGDGVNTWSSLSYFVNEDGFSAALGDYVEVSLLGEPDGIATLDGTGNVPLNQLGNAPTADFTGYATESFVDDLIGDATVDGTTGNTVTDRIGTKADASHTHVIGDVTSLQGALDGKQATITGGATTITGSNLTTSRALVSDGSGKVAVSAVTAAQLGHVAGVTSAIQTQLNARVNTVNGAVTTAATGSTVVRNITLSTADPSGGTDGQVWLKYV